MTTTELTPPALQQAKYRWLVPTIVAAGIVCRVVQYLWRRSYWDDESFIVYNLTHKTAAELMGPLTAAGPSQVAPPLWLLTERAMVVAFGTHEYSLRAIPLLAGIAALLTFALLARRLLVGWGYIGAVAMFAFSDRLIWKGTEVKPYISDVLVAILILLAALPARDERHSPLLRMLLAAAIAAVGIWLSYPTPFVFGGVSLALLPAIAREARGRWRRLTVWAIVNAMVVASTLGVYLVVVRDQQSGELNEYWADQFFAWSRPWELPLWLLNRWIRIGSYAGDVVGGVVAAAAVLGIVALRKRGDGHRLAIVLAPFLMALAADWLKLYPLDGRRLVSFLLPGMILLAGAGMATAVAWAQEPRRRWAMVLPVALIVPQVVLAAVALIVPRTRSHIRPAVEYVLSHRQPGETVFAGSFPAYCYWPDGEPLEKLQAGVKPAGRFWVILSFRPGRDAESIERYLQPARAVGRQLEPPYLVPGGGGAAYHFEPK